MSSSTMDLIRAARANALDDFKMRFKQKWYRELPCFHWRELKLSTALKTSMEHKHPSFYLLSFSEETLDLEDKVWEMQALENGLVLEGIENNSFQALDLDAWLENSLEKVKKENAVNQEDFILCYHEGTSSAAKEWRAHFEKELKI